MTIQTTNKTLKLPPVLNALAVVAQSSHDLLLEVERTKAIFHAQMSEKEKAFQELTARNALLEAQVASLNQMHQQEIAALRGEHAAEIARYATVKQADEGRIVELEGRVVHFTNAINELTPIIFTETRKTWQGRRITLTPALLENARAILDRAHKI